MPQVLPLVPEAGFDKIDQALIGLDTVLLERDGYEYTLYFRGRDEQRWFQLEEQFHRSIQLEYHGERAIAPGTGFACKPLTHLFLHGQMGAFDHVRFREQLEEYIP